MTAVAAPVPLWVRVRMAHAAVQFTLQAAGIPALHVKGPALSPQVAWPGRESTDTDVLIPKSRAAECLNVLANHGWALETRFENSSAFEHSANLHHEIWGYLDLHRIMPGFGIDPDEAFEILWRDHEMTEIAGVPCAVPTLPGQILVVLLHAGRSRLVGRAARDVEYAWSTADTATDDLPTRSRAACTTRPSDGWTRTETTPRTSCGLVYRPEGPRGPRNGRPGSGPLRRGRNAFGSQCGPPW